MSAPSAGRQRADRGWADERILGRGDFVAEMRRAGEPRAQLQQRRTPRLRAHSPSIS